MELKTNRLYFLDWLRVISIFLVFLHHVGMPFSGQSWLANYQESSDTLLAFMIFFQQWRLSLLFLISGAGTYLAFSKRSWLQYFWERTKRLLIPLYFGIFFISPPQTFYQFYDQYQSYWDLYPEVFINRPILHLWFIKMLYAFSVAIIPFILFLRAEQQNFFKDKISKLLKNPLAVFSLGLVFILIMVIVKKLFPYNADAFLTNYSTSVPFFLYFTTGILLASNAKSWWGLFDRRQFFLTLAVISTVAFYVFYFNREYFASLGISEEVLEVIWNSISGFMGWLVILSIISYAIKFLNFSNKWLKPLNEAIYPFYIIHQTILTVLAFYIVQLDLHWGIKLLMVMIGTLIGSAGVYKLIIYPLKPLWFFFGMKSKTDKTFNKSSNKKEVSSELV